MRNAGIKVWVLTGDKVDTAKNIGYSCKLLTQEGMELIEYPKVCEDLIKETHNLRTRQIEIRKKGLKIGYLITGELLNEILSGKSTELFDIVYLGSSSSVQWPLGAT